MTLLSNVPVAIALLFSLSSAMPHIQHANIEKVAIPGHCSRCEMIIESAGSLKKVASVEWDKCSKMATLTYDSTQTTKEEILERIALAGYDNDKFPASDEAYSQLHGCCQYERVNKTVIGQKEKSEEQYIRQYVSIAEPEQEVN